MSAYDVDIGMLMNGKRELQGTGRYYCCTPNKTIYEIDSYEDNNGILINASNMEDALYEFCVSALKQYREEDNNHDVYTFSLNIDTYHGSCTVYINNTESLLNSIQEALPYEKIRQKANTSQSDQDLYNNLLNDYQFSESDYGFIFDEWPERLQKYLGIYACISMEQPEWLNIDQTYMVEQSLLDSQLFLLAINVLNRLQSELSKLHRTDRFIAYVSAADGVGGDFLTTSHLIRKCLTNEQLYAAMPDVKLLDDAYETSLQTITTLSIQEQVQHWTAVLERGEFHPGSPYQYSKTDYEVYEQLLFLGEPAIAFINEQLNNRLKSDTAFILKAVISDLES
ncbi:hypothetical protein [Paenibacillus sp. GXUN7292]|uniref:hypothetical protein n=1 Tax=Paenibacillus sp. GXUN7292 TaxID=3422499 RepID=UPI003D7D6D85